MVLRFLKKHRYLKHRLRGLSINQLIDLEDIIDVELAKKFKRWDKRIAKKELIQDVEQYLTK